MLCETLPVQDMRAEAGRMPELPCLTLSEVGGADAYVCELAAERMASNLALLRAVRLAVPEEVTTKPFPETLVPLWSQQGVALLEQSVGPFQEIAENMVAQGPSQCGTTSLAVALNATRPPKASAVTVAQLHSELREELGASSDVFSASLEEIGCLARRYAGEAVTVVYASDSSCEAFRARAIAAMESGGVVVCNFKRAELGYASPYAGHFSPLAAYNAATDQFLVMDVARKNWQPVWVPTALLFSGMNTVDKPRDDAEGTRTRGFFVIDVAGPGAGCRLDDIVEPLLLEPSSHVLWIESAAQRPRATSGVPVVSML